MEFAFNASALAAGAVIERGTAVTTLDSLGSVMLTPTGGEGRGSVTSYFSEELELAHAETRVSSHRFFEKNRDGKSEEKFTTYTSVLMKGVNVFRRVNVGEMGVNMKSTRGFENNDDHEFEIVIWFRDVVVDGKKIRIKIDEKLMSLRRYDDLTAFVGSQQTAAATLAKRCEAHPDRLTETVRGRKPVSVPLVESITGWEHEALATIFVRGLGTFRFGELMLKPGQRRVNLIRATFGPRRNGAEADPAPQDEDPTPWGPSGGSMTLGSGEGNGIPIGP